MSRKAWYSLFAYLLIVICICGSLAQAFGFGRNPPW